LNRLKGLADKAISVRGDVSKLDEEFAKAFGVENPEGGLLMVIKYASIIATTMMDCHFMEDVQWTKNVSSLFSAYFDKAKSDEATEKVRLEAEKMLDIPEDDDEEDDAGTFKFVSLKYACY
jgi:elongation factor 3